MTPGEIEAELESHHRAGFAWSLACCGRNREEAEDVLQASYLKILDGRAEFAERSSFKTFLFGVIRRTASEARRRRRVAEIFLGRPRPSAPPDPVPEDRLDLLAALAKLPRRQREVLDLVFYAAMTVEEAARVMGVSAGSARAHYDRAKKRMAKLLDAPSPSREESHG
ncbi:MAG TPA: sigma-70 family RNA polymerase sigma factor [Thermoanaerobaculia bacterium]